MRKFIFVLGCLPLLLSAQSFQIRLSKNVLRSGENLQFEIVRTEEGKGHTLRGWQVFGNAPNLPADIRQVPGVFRRDAVREQDVNYVFGGVRNAVWLPRTEWNTDRKQISLPTGGWPAGDYRLGVTLITGTPDDRQVLVRTYQDLQIVPSVAEPDVLAGELWREGFQSLYKGVPLTAKTRFKIGSDARSIQVLIEAFEPDTTKLKAVHKSGSPHLWKDDGIEFAIAAAPGTTGQYKWMVNTRGEFSEFHQQDDNTGTGSLAFVRNWRGFAEVFSEVAADRYTVRLRIPFAALNFGEGTQWQFNVARSRYTVHPAEYSSFSPLRGELFDRPWEYTPINFPAYPGRSPLGLENISVKQHNGHSILQGDVVNHGREHRLVTVTGTLVSRGKPIILPEAVLSVPAGKYTRFTAALPDGIPAGDYTLECQFRALDNTLLQVVREKITIDNRTVFLKILKPGYRNAIFATMKDKRISAVAESRTGTGKQEMKFILTGPEGLRLEKKSVPGEPVEFDLASMPDGEYQLTVHGDSASDTQVIRKLPPRKGEIRIDEEGVTRVDGKRFLPCGWFRSSPNVPLPGNTAFMTYSRYRDPAEFRRCFNDFAGSTRTLGLVFPFQEFSGRFEYRHFNSSQLIGRLSEDQKKVLDRLIQTAVDAPVLGWYLADEPDMRDENPAWYAECRRYLTRIDPYRPTLMLNCTAGGIRDFQDGGDILIPDYYPDYFENGPRQPMNGLATFIRQASAYKPAWGVIQAFVWMPEQRGGGAPGRPPTFDELRNQFYQVFAANGKGVLLYDFYHSSQMFGVTRLGPDWLFAEAARLQDFLLDGNVRKGLQVIVAPSGSSHEVSLKKGESGRFCVIAVNTASRKVRMTFKGKFPEGLLYVASEKRNVEVKDGSFSDDFEPLAVHLYVNSATVADGTETVDQVRRRIADEEAKRTVPGNRAAFGAPRLLDYINAKKGVFPAGRPQITASSETSRYFTNTWGTALQLLDGIRESYPRDGHMIWQPAKDDKRPALTLTLPQEETVRELRFYRVKGWKLYGGRDEAAGLSLPGGKVSVRTENGDWRMAAEFAESDLDCLSVPLLQGKAKELRIEFEHSNFALSELEVF